MEIKYERVEGTSFPFRAALLGFAGLALVGLLSTLWISKHGIGYTGMTNRVPWGLQIVMAIYYIGLSAGSLVISGLYGVFGKLEYKPFARIAVYLAMLLIIAALLSILTDQGRLDRVFVQPFVHFNLVSMFSINPILYNGYILICLVYLWALFTERKRMTTVVATLAFAWAFGLHSGTGAIFGFGPRVLYESPLLPASFVVAAMASGTAFMIVLIVGIFRATNRPLDDDLIRWLGRFLAICVLVVLYFLFVENAYRLYMVELREAAHYFLFGGFHSLLFWIGLIFFGLVVPTGILFHPRTGKSIPWILLASALVIFGVLCERYVIVIPGLTNPPDLFPGMEIVHDPALVEGVANYSIGHLEVFQALGVLGFTGLLFLLGLKYLPLLPSEARAHARLPALHIGIGTEKGDITDIDAGRRRG